MQDGGGRSGRGMLEKGGVGLDLGCWLEREEEEEEAGGLHIFWFGRRLVGRQSGRGFRGDLSRVVDLGRVVGFCMAAGVCSCMVRLVFDIVRPSLCKRCFVFFLAIFSS